MQTDLTHFIKFFLFNFDLLNGKNTKFRSIASQSQFPKIVSNRKFQLFACAMSYNRSIDSLLYIYKFIFKWK